MTRRRWWAIYGLCLAFAVVGLGLAGWGQYAPTWLRCACGVAGAYFALLTSALQYEHPARREREAAATRLATAEAEALRGADAEAREVRELAQTNGHARR